MFDNCIIKQGIDISWEWTYKHVILRHSDWCSDRQRTSEHLVEVKIDSEGILPDIWFYILGISLYY